MPLRTQATCAVAIAAFSTAVNAQVVLGPGDVFQQDDSVGSFGEAIDLTVLDGGQIIARADGSRTTFNTGPLRFHGGSMETELSLRDSAEIFVSGGAFTSVVEVTQSTMTIAGGSFLDTGEFFGLEVSQSTVNISGGSYARRANFRSSDVNISGGTFGNDPFNISGVTLDIATGSVTGGSFQNFEIDRQASGSLIEISGGTYQQFTIDRQAVDGRVEISGGTFFTEVSIERSGGDVLIRGGDFQGGLGLLLPELDTATFTFEGTDWQFNGTVVDFGSGDTFMPGATGLLEGVLVDGNPFSVNIGSTWDVTLVNIPSPSSASFLALAGVIAARRRR